MITQADLAALTIERAIIHDIPRRLRGEEAQPDLSQTDSPLDDDTVVHLHRKIVGTIGGRSAYELVFLERTESPVPPIVRQYTASRRNRDDFVNKSQRLATHLFELQRGSSSPGLLCVLDCVAASRRALAILKVERESGARLNSTLRDGKRTLQMSVVRDLLLTTGTKLFKNALFLRSGSGDDDFLISACDTQRSTTNIEMAQFWSSFLGCELKEAPRIATKRFFELNREYIKTSVPDAVEKSNWYDHTVSELKSQKRSILPRQFIEDYVPRHHQQPFEDFLRENKFPLRQFSLDASDIASKLRRLSYHTDRGATVSVPADEQDIVSIEADRIIVTDPVSSVG